MYPYRLNTCLKLFLVILHTNNSIKKYFSMCLVGPPGPVGPPGEDGDKGDIGYNVL